MKDNIFVKFKSSLVFESFVAFFFQFSGMGILYLLIIFITKRIGVSEYGEFVIFLLVSKGLSILFTFGLDGFGVNRFIELSINNERSFLFAKKGVELILLIITITSGIVVILYYFNLTVKGIDFSTILYSILYAIPFSIIKFLIQFIRAKKKTGKYSFFEHFFIPFISILIIVFMHFFLGMSISIAEIQIILISVAFLELILVFRIFRKLDIFKEQNEMESVKVIVSNSLPFFVPAILIFASINLNSLFINFQLSKTEVAVYDIAFKITQLLGLPLMALNVVIAPKFSQLYISGKKNELFKLWSKTVVIGTCGFLPFFIIFMIYPELPIKLFINDTVIGEPVLKILLVGQLINVISGSVGMLLQMTSNEKIFLKITFISVVLNILLNITLIPKFGLIGSAYSNLLSFSLINILSIIFMIIINKKWQQS